MKTFFSMECASVMLLILALACAIATFIETAYGTEVAWAMVYSTAWFGALMVLLGINLTYNIYRYRMIKLRTLPALIFHASFLFMLAGAILTRYFGFEGNIHIREGGESSIVTTKDEVVQLLTLGSDGEFISADESKFLNGAGRMNFDLNLDVEGRIANLKFKELVEHGELKWVQDPTGQAPARVELLFSNNVGSQNVSLQSGESMEIGELSITFNAEPKSKNFIYIKSKDGKFYLNSSLDINATKMADMSTSPLKRNEDNPLGNLLLYSFDGINFAPVSLLSSAVEKFVPVDANLPGEPGVVATLSFAGQSREIYVPRDSHGASYKVGDKNFIVALAPKMLHLPFKIALRDFVMDRYPGTNSPSGYKSEITLKDGNSSFDYDIFMNHVLDYGGYRFFQSSYDTDERGTVLSVNKDPGKVPTYIGYFLLCVGMFFNFFNRGSRFFKLSRLISENTHLAREKDVNSKNSASSSVPVSSAESSASKRAKKSRRGTKGAALALVGALALSLSALYPSVANAEQSSTTQNSTSQNSASNAAAENPAPQSPASVQNSTSQNFVQNSAAENSNQSSTPQESAAEQGSVPPHNFSTMGGELAVPKFDPKFSEDLASLVIQGFDGRMEPFDTVSRELLNKIYRADNYKAPNGEILNHNAAALSFMLNQSYWRRAPIIKVSEPELKKILGMDEKQSHASMMDFFEFKGGESYYKLDKMVEEINRKPLGNRGVLDKEIIKVNERVNVFYSAFMGDDFRIIPVKNAKNNEWLSPLYLGDALDQNESAEVKKMMGIFVSSVVYAQESGDWSGAEKMLSYVKKYQAQNGANLMPSESAIKYEILFNKTKIFSRLFPIYTISGFLLLIFIFLRMMKPALRLGGAFKLVYIVNIVAFIAHTAGLALRGYVSGHAPWSNSYESLIYIAWALSLSGIFFSRKSAISLALTSIMAGITLMVAHLSDIDPQITNLQPVLKSHWLTIHVSVITASYGFLGLCMLLGIFTIVMFLFDKKNPEIARNIAEATHINEMSMILGLCLLTVGNFLGGVWANESWGRYWGWDPKETWALITIFIYAVVVHFRFMPKLNNQFAFAVASMFAYFSVIMTYFGVNFYLSGMHSYASGERIPVPGWAYVMVASMIALAIAAYFRSGKSARL